MNTTGVIAAMITAVAFVLFYVMATVAVKQISLKAWHAAIMSITVLILLLLIMREATQIGATSGGWGDAVPEKAIDGRLQGD